MSKMPSVRLAKEGDYVDVIPPQGFGALTSKRLASGVQRVSAGKPVADAPAPEPPPTNPSGQAMPTGDLPGWRHLFADDFLTDCAEGGFPAAYPAWSSYPTTYKDSSKFGTYDPKVVSVFGSVLRQRLRYEGGKYLVSSISPRIDSDRYQLYGRYAVRFRAEELVGYKAAWLLWPQSEVWPRDGEIDFPEGSFHDTIEGYMHRQGATSGGDQAAVDTGKRWGPWHTAIIEWSPGRCTFILDGVAVLTTTERVPNTPMRWQLQSETRIISTPPPQTTVQDVYIDWVSVWAYAP